MLRLEKRKVAVSRHHPQIQSGKLEQVELRALEEQVAVVVEVPVDFVIVVFAKEMRYWLV